MSDYPHLQNAITAYWTVRGLDKQGSGLWCAPTPPHCPIDVDCPCGTAARCDLAPGHSGECVNKAHSKHGMKGIACDGCGKQHADLAQCDFTDVALAHEVVHEFCPECIEQVRALLRLFCRQTFAKVSGRE